MLQIENTLLRAQVNPLGAELSGLCSRKDTYEYLWQGDPAIWTGRSPLLFPAVGKLQNDRYTYNGKAYSLEKHGFIRHEEFKVYAHEKDSLTLCYENWQKHFESYPFAYRLFVCFSLQENTLAVTHTVESLQDAPLYFSLGAHPGLNCGKGAMLQFDCKETVQAMRFGEGMIIRSEEPFLQNSDTYRLTDHTFDRDAYVLQGLTSPGVTVCGPQMRRVHVDFGGAPYLGIWAKPAAPYVCIEPWYGLDDDDRQSGAIEEKKGIVCLPGRERFNFRIAITVG